MRIQTLGEGVSISESNAGGSWRSMMLSSSLRRRPSCSVGSSFTTHTISNEPIVSCPAGRPRGAQHLLPHRAPPVARPAPTPQARRARCSHTCVVGGCHPADAAGSPPDWLSGLSARLGGGVSDGAAAAPRRQCCCLVHPCLAATGPACSPCVCSIAYWVTFVPLRLVLYPALVPVFLAEMRAESASWLETLVCVGSQVGQSAGRLRSAQGAWGGMGVVVGRVCVGCVGGGLGWGRAGGRGGRLWMPADGRQRRRQQVAGRSWHWGAAALQACVATAVCACPAHRQVVLLL